MKSTFLSAETFDELAPRQATGGFALEKTLATMAHRDLLTDAKYIINTAQTTAYRSVNAALVYRNWHLGKRIAEEILKGEDRAEYGKAIISRLADDLTLEYGSGFDASNLYKFQKFSELFPILDTLCPESSSLLPWSHFRTLLQVSKPEARQWYIKEASEQGWSVRTLQRNISSQYFERMLLSQHKEVVREEMREITRPLQDKLEFIKNPVIAEFLGYKQNSDFTETDLEKRIIANIKDFLMELGKGYAFIAEQQHIRTEKEDYYIDLVFYNYILKCFVLIDLKTSKVTHQDVGQMDMYVRMYDELKKGEGDNPTLGILLCADTDADIARYSILKGNEQLFATRYMLCLPSDEELRAEIETQKQIYFEQFANGQKGGHK